MLWSSCSNYIKVRKCAWTMVITHYKLFFFTYNASVSAYSIDNEIKTMKRKEVFSHFEN